MTETDERAAGTELAQVAPGTLAYTTATDPGAKWDLAKLAGMLADEASPVAEAPAVTPPEQVEITDELRADLLRLPEVFGGVAPTEPRKLEKAEVARITRENSLLTRVNAALGKRGKAIDEAIRCHMDAIAPEGRPVVTEGVAKGHVLVAEAGEPFEVPVDGYEDAWQQRKVPGKAELSLGILADMLAEHVITREEFLSLTTSVRVLDEGKIKAAIRRHPARTLAILKRATVRKADTASLYPPKK